MPKERPLEPGPYDCDCRVDENGEKVCEPLNHRIYGKRARTQEGIALEYQRLLEYRRRMGQA
jgi:hypothetical protein